MPQNELDWGNWNAICDTCGFKFKASELRKKWDGTMVCETDFEQRHPQDFLRVRGDQPAVPWSRPEPEDVFIQICFIWERTAYADMATADCARADNTQIPYALALELRGPVEDDLLLLSSLPGYAIPGSAIPGA